MLEFDTLRDVNTERYPMSLVRKIISRDQMDIFGYKPTDPLESITEALAVARTEGPMEADRIPRRTGCSYPPWSLRRMGVRNKASGSGMTTSMSKAHGRECIPKCPSNKGRPGYETARPEDSNELSKTWAFGRASTRTNTRNPGHRKWSKIEHNWMQKYW